VKNKKSSALDTWLTPRDFYQELNNRFRFDNFDPCPPDCNLSVFNGLLVDWAARTFVNPPYSKADKEKFLYKGFEEALKGKLVVFLIPVSTSTKVFHELILPNAKVEFIRGRLKFEGIDRDGNWVNPHCGCSKLPNIPSHAQQVFRSGQNDSMLVIFGKE
jgi:DNA N-6-adenine-methyltransferase (Dam)